MSDKLTSDGHKAMEAIAKQLFQLYEAYYQREVFNIDAGLDFMVYLEIMEVNPSIMDRLYKDIVKNTDVIDREITSLNIELFGLAWLDYNYRLFEEGKQDSNKCDFALCSEIVVAKSYLEKSGGGDIWNATGFYNRAILEAAVAQSNSTDWSIPRDLPAYYERATRSQQPEKFIRLGVESHTEHFDKFLKGHFDKLIENKNDRELALRLSNRLESVLPWRNGIMISQKLSSALAQRIGLSPNPDTLFLLQRLTVGLYENAANYINAVIEYGTWELARKESIDLRQTLLKWGQEALEEQKEARRKKRDR